MPRKQKRSPRKGRPFFLYSSSEEGVKNARGAVQITIELENADGGRKGNLTRTFQLRSTVRDVASAVEPAVSKLARSKLFS